MTAARVSLTLPMPPSVNNLFANKRGGGRFKSERYAAWITAAGWELIRQRPGAIAGRYEIEISVFRPDNRRRDIGNIEKAVSDLLVSQRVISDDSLAQKITLQWLAPRAGDSGCRVTLTEYEGAI